MKQFIFIACVFINLVIHLPNWYMNVFSLLQLMQDSFNSPSDSPYATIQSVSAQIVGDCWDEAVVPKLFHNLIEMSLIIIPGNWPKTWVVFLARMVNLASVTGFFPTSTHCMVYQKDYHRFNMLSKVFRQCHSGSTLVSIVILQVLIYACGSCSR